MSRTPAEPGRLVVDVHLDAAAWQTDRARAVQRGLTSVPPTLSPMWFYDDRGSHLFDEITRLPEYYQTRAEHQLLQDHALDLVGKDIATLVELGSGTSHKTEVIIEALVEDRLRTYVPFDVSEGTVRDAIDRLAARFDRLRFHGVIGDFDLHLREIPTDGVRLVAFLGGTIGNLVPNERHRFLSDLRSTLDERDLVLVGIDLVKDPDLIVAAYDDASGVTAEFNRNALSVVNRELGADFEPAEYEHVACWNADQQWVEMRLRSRRSQTVKIPTLDLVIDFAAGDEILTEISAKFTVAGFSAELRAAGYEPESVWRSPRDEFGLVLARPRAGRADQLRERASRAVM